MILSNLAPPVKPCQLALSWDSSPRTTAKHRDEWVNGSAVSLAVTELALVSVAGQQQVMEFLRPKAINAHRTYGGAMPMNKPAINARRKFSDQCRGGWLAYGHAPIENGELVPVTYKPDIARINEKGKPIKYERPAGSKPTPYFSPLDADAYYLIAERAGLNAPTFESSWSAWLWLLKQDKVDLVIDEGEKKAAAACANGFLTIGLAGIWNGCPRLRDTTGLPFGAPTLIAELQWLASIRPSKAPIIIAFDASESARGRVDIRNARQKLGRLLAEAGHHVRIREMQQPDGAATFIKGTDDLLVFGGANALNALKIVDFDVWTKESSKKAITDHLLQPFHTSNRRHQVIARHFKASDIPHDANLVALIGGLGSNKTGAIADYKPREQPLSQVVAAACDGACKGNPGKGGYGAILRFADGGSIEIGGAEKETTNNRMELKAAIELLKTLQSLDISDGLKIETDSKYVQKGFDEWITNWKRNGWRTSSGEPVSNSDLWQEIDQLRIKGLSMKWVKGHAGHALNERCDTIASDFAAGLVPQLKNDSPRKKGVTGKLVSITHRRSLADNQGHRFGLAIKREGQALNASTQSQGSLRQIEQAENDGFVTVADSSYIGGSGELRPEHCSGAVLFIDEADAFLRHCLMAATAIKNHRCDVLTNLAKCVAAAKQVVLAGAHIDETTLLAFERMRGCSSTIVESTMQTAASRTCVAFDKIGQLLEKIENLAINKQPFLFHTASAEDASKMAPHNLAKFIRNYWPDARILELTAKTIREPEHPAAAAMVNPSRLLDFDVVLATPVLETGFSIEDPTQHFKAVLGHTSGHTLPQAFVQSLGRLRTGVERFIWCCHNGSKLGNGAPCADDVERIKLHHANRLDLIDLVQLHEANDAIGNSAQFVRWWSEIAAHQNWLANYYRHAVEVLLTREGYSVNWQNSDVDTKPLIDELTEARDATVEAETTAVAAAEPILPSRLIELEKQQRLTREQRRQMERAQIERDLGIKIPSPEQVQCSRNNCYGKALLHLLMVNSDVRHQWHQTAAGAAGRFAPDVTKAMAPSTRAKLLAGMPWLHKLIGLAGTGQTFIPFDFEQQHQDAIAQRGIWRELLGFDPGGITARTFLNQMLKLIGFKLQRTSRRETIAEIGKTYWHYEVVDDLAAVDREKVHHHLVGVISSVSK